MHRKQFEFFFCLSHYLKNLGEVYSRTHTYMSSYDLGTLLFKGFSLLIPWILLASGIAITIAYATENAGMEGALGWGITFIILGAIGILAEFRGFSLFRFFFGFVWKPMLKQHFFSFVQVYFSTHFCLHGKQPT